MFRFKKCPSLFGFSRSNSFSDLCAKSSASKLTGQDSNISTNYRSKSLSESSSFVDSNLEFEFGSTLQKIRELQDKQKALGLNAEINQALKDIEHQISDAQYKKDTDDIGNISSIEQLKIDLEIMQEMQKIAPALNPGVTLSDIRNSVANNYACSNATTSSNNKAESTYAVSESTYTISEYGTPYTSETKQRSLSNTISHY